mmetsp:Transcript_14164/g.30499  ORF Transcript_14164/g.30499 Transcript_14164/m.30499 type:complete len:380 (+) Transcript_14164:2609-3748(+)
MAAVGEPIARLFARGKHRAGRRGRAHLPRAERRRQRSHTRVLRRALDRAVRARRRVHTKRHRALLHRALNAALHVISRGVRTRRHVSVASTRLLRHSKHKRLSRRRESPERGFFVLTVVRNCLDRHSAAFEQIKRDGRRRPLLLAEVLCKRRNPRVLRRALDVTLRALRKIHARRRRCRLELLLERVGEVLVRKHHVARLEKLHRAGAFWWGDSLQVEVHAGGQVKRTFRVRLGSSHRRLLLVCGGVQLAFEARVGLRLHELLVHVRHPVVQRKSHPNCRRRLACCRFAPAAHHRTAEPRITRTHTAAHKRPNKSSRLHSLFLLNAVHKPYSLSSSSIDLPQRNLTQVLHESSMTHMASVVSLLISERDNAVFRIVMEQ